MIYLDLRKHNLHFGYSLLIYIKSYVQYFNFWLSTILLRNSIYISFAYCLCAIIISSVDALDFLSNYLLSMSGDSGDNISSGEPSTDGGNPNTEPGGSNPGGGDSNSPPGNPGAEIQTTHLYIRR